MPPFAITTPAATCRATRASAPAMRCWLAASTSAGSRSRSVATTASPAVPMRSRAARRDPLDLGIGAVAGQGGHARRHARVGMPLLEALELGSRGRDERAAHDEHAALTAGSGRCARSRAGERRHECRRASHDHRAAGVLGRAQATGDRAQVVVALGIRDHRNRAPALGRRADRRGEVGGAGRSSQALRAGSRPPRPRRSGRRCAPPPSGQVGVASRPARRRGRTRCDRAERARRRARAGGRRRS